jgi:hypothetical protein
MTHFDLRAWNGLFRRRGTMTWIRSQIARALKKGDTVIVYDTGATGLSDKTMVRIRKGWPVSKVRFPRPHPTSGRKLKARRGEVPYLFP